MSDEQIPCIRIFSDASVRDGATGLGYSLKARRPKGTVVQLETGRVRIEQEIGTTQAEYQAMLKSTTKARKYNAENAVLYSDNREVVEAIRGQEGFAPSPYHQERLEANLNRYGRWRVFQCSRGENTTSHGEARLATSGMAVGNGTIAYAGGD